MWIQIILHHLRSNFTVVGEYLYLPLSMHISWMYIFYTVTYTSYTTSYTHLFMISIILEIQEERKCDNTRFITVLKSQRLKEEIKFITSLLKTKKWRLRALKHFKVEHDENVTTFLYLNVQNKQKQFDKIKSWKEQEFTQCRLNESWSQGKEACYSLAKDLNSFMNL